MRFKKYQTQFNRIKKNMPFRLGGTTWIKKSSRTAITKESPNRVFYFSKNETVSFSVLGNQTLSQFVSN